MSTLSTRLSLELPDANDPMRKGDSVLASNYRILDKNMHVRYESALANITSPYQGQFALDTDLDEVMYYSSGWKFFGANKVPQGRYNVANDRFVSEGSDAPPGGTPTKIHETTNTVPLVAGRRYVANLSGNISPTGTNTSHNPVITIRVSTTTTTASDTVLFSAVAYNHSGSIGAAKATTFTWSHYFTVDAPVNIGAGSYYFGVFLDCNNANMTDTYRTISSAAPHHSHLIIEDCGI